MKTDLTSIYIERAKALALFGRFDEAHQALAIARKNLNPELTCWQVNLLIEEAKTYALQGDISACCHVPLEALPIVRAISLPSKETKITHLYKQCRQREPNNAVVKSLGKIVPSQAS